MTIRRLGPGSHQPRGLDPGGRDADHGPKRRNQKSPQGGERRRSGRARGEPRRGEGATPPGAPSGAREDTMSGRDLAEAMRELTQVMRQAVGQQAMQTGTIAWSVVDARFAELAATRPLRPIANKTPEEARFLARMRAPRRKDRA